MKQSPYGVRLRLQVSHTYANSFISLTGYRYNKVKIEDKVSINAISLFDTRNIFKIAKIEVPSKF